MFVYTRCRTCGGQLLLGKAPECNAQQSPYWHDGCDPKPTKLERLLADFRAAAMMGDQPDLEAKLEAEIDELASRPPRLLDAAVQYAKWGWLVHPLRAGTKEPATKHGFEDATTDVDRIRAWWERRPSDNIGLATGHRFDVIDVDVPKRNSDGSWKPGGMETYLDMLTEDRLPDCHGMAVTAAGGLHIYIQATGRGNGSGVKPGIDIRGKGGYVVAPPSILVPTKGAKPHPGGKYTWTYVPSPTLTDGQQRMG